MLAAWLHDLDPYFVKLWDGGPIRWYGLSYLAAFVLGWLLVIRITKAGRSPLETARTADFTVAIALGAVIGGRLGYCVFYEPSLLTEFTSQAPFWGVLAINNGGMASHGGMIGTVAAAWVFALRHKVPAMHGLDLTSFAAPLGLALGRLANFVNGELYGRPVDDDFPLAVRFPQEIYEEREVAERVWFALDESGMPLEQAANLEWVITAIQNGNEFVTPIVEPLLTPRHPSQLYAAAMEGLAVFVVLALFWLKPRKPGTVTALFGITYGMMRILDERFRLPDAQFIAADGTLPAITRGQLLSGVMVLAGVVMFIWCQKRSAEPLGSWRRGPWSPDQPKTEPAAEKAPS